MTSPDERGRRFAGMALGAAIVALIDLASKAAAVRNIEEPVELTGFLSLTVVRNPGVAFGLGTALPTPLLLGITISVALLLGWLVFTGHLQQSVAAALILGGAVANIIDRAGDGSVVDVIDVGWWPTFNLADIAIVTGIGLLLLQSFQVRDDGPATQAAVDEKTGENGG